MYCGLPKMIFWSHVPGLPSTVHVALPFPTRRAGIICRRNWSLLHWQRSSSVTDSKLYCFLVATRERCRHDFVIRSRGHKLVPQLISTVSQTMETMEHLDKSLSEHPEFATQQILIYRLNYCCYTTLPIFVPLLKFPGPPNLTIFISLHWLKLQEHI